MDLRPTSHRETVIGGKLRNPISWDSWEWEHMFELYSGGGSLAVQHAGVVGSSERPPGGGSEVPGEPGLPADGYRAGSLAGTTQRDPGGTGAPGSGVRGQQPATRVQELQQLGRGEARQPRQAAAAAATTLGEHQDQKLVAADRSLGVPRRLRVGLSGPQIPLRGSRLPGGHLGVGFHFTAGCGLGRVADQEEHQMREGGRAGVRLGLRRGL